MGRSNFENCVRHVSVSYFIQFRKVIL